MIKRSSEGENGTRDEQPPAGRREPQYMDNPPACGASRNWPWGYLPCGCHNDGYGRHVR